MEKKTSKYDNIETRRRYRDITKLTDAEKQAYSLYRQGMKADQIAGQMGLAVATARHKLAKAKEKITYGGEWET